MHAPHLDSRGGVSCRDEILGVIRIASEAGLRPLTGDKIPRCLDRPVFWNDQSYTFLAMVFRKEA